MIKTLRTSFALKNTYRVNSILYSLKQIPLIKRILPDTLYQVGELKVLANVVSVLWEIVSVFIWKFLYFWLMLYGAASLYQSPEPAGLFLHILLFLTIGGALVNTYLFNPSRDKYYAMILMRMDARSYTLANYGYAMIKVIVGFLPPALLFAAMMQVPVWVCILIPFFVAGMKLIIAAISLVRYQKNAAPANENRLGKLVWLLIVLLLCAAYGLPAMGIVLPVTAVVVLMLATVLAAVFSVRIIVTFPSYRSVYQQLLSDSMHQMDKAKTKELDQSRRVISADTGITSRRKGFEYLNELFIRRHQKILWKASSRIAAVCTVLILGMLVAFYFVPEVKTITNRLLLTYLPYFVFIMYAINRGTGFTRALFMNCDHSLLTYPFYKQPKLVLQLFVIRLREIIKINLLPAAVIGCGLALLLFASGGTDNVWNYAILVISITGLSIFFSVHYLTIYYLLQPYNAGTEAKSGTYQLVLTATYLVCFYMMRLRMSTFVFGLLTIVFCVIYCVVASILVYKFAPRTFRLRP